MEQLPEYPLYSPDSPPYLIRTMTPEDMGAVRHVDRDAFEGYRRQQRQMGRPLYLRTTENMEAALRRPHPGVVIEWPENRIVGYCFTHVWGKLGWLGTLGVVPRNQGFGLGRAVIAAGLDAIKAAGCTIFALETMPESGKNVALYTRLGLEPRELTLLCQGSPETAESTHFELWTTGDRALCTVAEQIIPSLDPTPAARWLFEEGAGETLIWHEDGHAVAFAALRNAPRRMDNMHTHLTIEVAACLPEAAAHWPRYLSEMQAYARSVGKMGLLLPINAAQVNLLRRTLDSGMQIVHSRVRMVSGARLGGPDDILIMTLAM